VTHGNSNLKKVTFSLEIVDSYKNIQNIVTWKRRLDVVKRGEGGVCCRRGRVVVADGRHERAEQRRRVGKSGGQRRCGGLLAIIHFFTRQ
jgi:hypothetical protein